MSTDNREGWTPRVAGLDLSLTSTGMSDGLTHYATQTTPDACVEERLDMILKSVALFLSGTLAWDREADLAVIEDEAWTSARQKGHAELSAIRLMVRRRCWALGIPFALVSPTTLKLYTTGNGRATKQQMLAALVRDHVGTVDKLPAVKVKDGRYDMTDALALAAMGYNHIHRLNEPEAHYRPALDTVKWPHLTCT